MAAALTLESVKPPIWMLYVEVVYLVLLKIHKIQIWIVYVSFIILAIYVALYVVFTNHDPGWHAYYDFSMVYKKSLSFLYLHKLYNLSHTQHYILHALVATNTQYI